MWRYEFHIKGIEIDKENTELLIEKLQKSLATIGTEPYFTQKTRDAMLILNANVKDIDPSQAAVETEKIISDFQEHLTDASGLIRVFQLITPITTFRQQITTEQVTEKVFETDSTSTSALKSGDLSHPIWAEIKEGNEYSTTPQHQLHSRYTSVFATPTKMYRATIDIPIEMMTMAIIRPRQDFAEMVKVSQTDLVPISNTFRDLQKTENLSNEKLANTILSFVQHIPYVKDKVSAGMEDYHAYAIETLANGLGDCEDKSILMAAILENLNYDTILINPYAHIAVGIAGDFKGYGIDFEGKHYYYAETTTPGWQIGELRADLINAEMNAIPL